MYNKRTNNPTHWEEKIYTGPDYLEKMLREKAGNVVVLAGNNSNKIEFIYKSVEGGFNVLADKPMCAQRDSCLTRLEPHLIRRFLFAKMRNFRCSGLVCSRKWKREKSWILVKSLRLSGLRTFHLRIIVTRSTGFIRPSSVVRHIKSTIRFRSRLR